MNTTTATYKITLENIKGAGIDPDRTGIARFIPAQGAPVQEFLRLPLEPYLTGVSSRSFNEVRFRILSAKGVLPEKHLHRLALNYAEKCPPFSELNAYYYPEVHNALRTKKAWLDGNISKSALINARQGLFRRLKIWHNSYYRDYRNTGEFITGNVAARAIHACTSPCILEAARLGIHYFLITIDKAYIKPHNEYLRSLLKKLFRYHIKDINRALRLKKRACYEKSKKFTRRYTKPFSRNSVSYQISNSEKITPPGSDLRHDRRKTNDGNEKALKRTENNPLLRPVHERAPPGSGPGY